MRRVLLLFAVAACGRIGFDGEAAPGDGGGGDDAAGVFTAANVPSGGDVWSLATTPAAPDVMMAVAAGRLMRSTDAGVTWSECARGDYSNSVAISPSDANTVYAGDDAGIYRSNDACATWTRLAERKGVGPIQFVGGKVLFGFGGGIAEVRGDMVSTVSGPMTDHAVYAISARGSVVFAAAEDVGLLRSTDGGTTFALAATGLPTDVVDQVAWLSATTLLVATDYGAFRSDDGGDNWVGVAGAEDVRDYIAADPADPTFAVATSWHGIRATYDGAATFDVENKRATAMANSYVNGFAFAGGKVFAGTGRGLFVADDHDLDWRQVRPWPAAWSIQDLTRAPGQGLLYAASTAGVLVSDDDGATWTVHADDMSPIHSNCVSVAIAANATHEVYAAGFPTLWWSGNDGDTYERTSASASAFDEWSFTVVRSVGDEVWLGSQTQVWHSTNRAVDWNDDLINGDAHATYDFAIRAPDDVWLATSGGVFHTVDHGGSYDEEGGGTADTPQVFTLLATTDGQLLNGGLDGVRRRTGAATWAPIGLQGIAVWDLLEANGAWLAATASGVYVTHDAGATWMPVPGLEDRRPSTLSLDDAGDLVVGTWGWGIYKTPLP